MGRTTHKELLDAGVHFGHLKRKRNPNMAPYIFMEKNGIHIIDLNKTVVKVEEACAALKQIAKSGRKVLFVATKKQAKDIVATLVGKVKMPYATERWPGGMLTNFHTIRKAVKKMGTIDKMATDGTMDNMSKREKLQIARQRAKLERNLGSFADLTRLPAAIFIVDILKEKIAVSEAQKLNIPMYAMVDTNSDPNQVDYVIPSNDDSSKSISMIVGLATNAIAEGLEERRHEKLAEKETKDEKDLDKTEKLAEGEETVETVETVGADADKGEPKADTAPKPGTSARKPGSKRKRIGQVEGASKETKPAKKGAAKGTAKSKNKAKASA
ncbi:MAG: 30S ribosomal protein S2 [Flavobacteriales bacterium]|nr:30S ribosomal protein S2 [Flavobacteriales bacterium]